MSLFPAYANGAPTSEPANRDSDLKWLENESFDVPPPPPPPACAPASTTNESIERTVNADEPKHKRKRKHKEHHATHKEQVAETKVENEVYMIDNTYDKMLLLVPHLSKYDAKKYKRWRTGARASHDTTTKLKRYFKCSRGGDDEEAASSTVISDAQDILAQTEYYNKYLNGNPSDVDMWLKYVDYQYETVHQYNRMHMKGTINKNVRLIAEKQLSIVEKAIALNADKDVSKLYSKYVSILSDQYEFDEQVKLIRTLLEQDPSSSGGGGDHQVVVLWRGLIHLNQYSMIHCNTDNVFTVYKQCFNHLNTNRVRVRTNATSSIELNIINIFNELCLFLRQTGLYEHLSTLIQMYIDLNVIVGPDRACALTTSATTLGDDELLEYEALILKSNLPTHELWFRIEKLRESVHFTPLESDDAVHGHDPQRLVFVDELNEFIYPILNVGNIKTLISMMMNVLKVPQMPHRHQHHRHRHHLSGGVDVDAVESLLPIFMSVTSHISPLNAAESSHNVHIYRKHLLSLVNGPQYMNSPIGGIHYMHYVSNVFKYMVHNSSHHAHHSSVKLFVCRLYIRFQRLLLALHRHQLMTLSKQHVKHIHKSIHDVLQMPDARDSIHLYKEYAIIKYEQQQQQQQQQSNSTRSSSNNEHYNVLIRLLKSINATNTSKDVLRVAPVYRTIVEMLLNDGVAQTRGARLLTVLFDYVDTNDTELLTNIIHTDTRVEVEQEQEQEQELDVYDKYTKTTDAILNDWMQQLEQATGAGGDTSPGVSEDDDDDDDDATIDWLMLYCTHLLLREPTDGAGDDVGLHKTDRFMKQRVLQPLLVHDARKHELLYESYVRLLYWYHRRSQAHNSRSSYKVFVESLMDAVQLCPNNYELLAILLNVQTNSGGGIVEPIWKLNSVLSRTNQCVPILVLILIIEQRFEDRRQRTNQCNDGADDESKYNKLVSLYERYTKHPSTKHCALLWRLYLKFLYKHQNTEKCRNVYYMACETCPWLKALYMDAAVYIPTDLPQIQDLIIEKQLRIHLTAEELQALIH